MMEILNMLQAIRHEVVNQIFVFLFHNKVAPCAWCFSGAFCWSSQALFSDSRFWTEWQRTESVLHSLNLRSASTFLKLWSVSFSRSQWPAIDAKYAVLSSESFSLSDACLRILNELKAILHSKSAINGGPFLKSYFSNANILYLEQIGD